MKISSYFIQKLSVEDKGFVTNIYETFWTTPYKGATGEIKQYEKCK